MFESEKLPHHVQSVKFSGDEEKPSLTVSFYMTPLPYNVAYEISDRIAKQLFRREGKNEVPVTELGKVMFNLGDIPAVNIEVYPHNAEGAGGAGRLLAGCKITEVFADKLFSDKPDWSLIWKCIIPMDSHSIDLMRTYYRKTCFLTLVDAQDTLLDDSKPIVLNDAEVESGKEILCQVCDNRASWLGADNSGWCDTDVKAAVGVQVRRIKYTGEAVASAAS